MPDETVLDAWLDLWEDLRASGQAVSLDEFVVRHCAGAPPALVQEFKARALALLSVEGQLGGAQQRSTSGGKGGDTGPSRPKATLLAEGTEPVPGYKLVQRLGRGGFGEVWEATGPGGFPVALKFVPLGDRAGAIERDALELLKRLRHPHLLAVFGAWQVSGWLAVACELAQGTLADRLRECRRQGLPGLPGPELLRHMEEAAEGLDYLNGAGVLHRDVKPQNLLLVGGAVKVGDYGLVKLLEGTRASHSGSLTAAYAPPEFFQGKASRHSDQYSLAVSYCELRGGKLPFTGTALELLRGHTREPPDLTMLPGPERGGVGRALAKEPGQRWPSCRAFVAALAGGPAAVAGPPARPTRRWRPWLASGLGLALIVGVVLAVLAWRGQQNRPEEAARVERPADSPAPAAGGDTRRGVTDEGLRALLQRERDPGTDPEQLRLDALDFRRRHAGTAQAGSAGSLLCRLPSPLDRLDRGTIPLYEQTVAGGGDPARLPDGVVAIWGDSRLKHWRDVHSVAFSPDGKVLASGGADGLVKLWNSSTGRERASLAGHRSSVRGVAFSPDGRRLASACEDRTVRLWDVDTGKNLATLEQAASVYSVAFGQTGRLLAAADADGRVILWEPDTRRPVRTLSGHAGPVWSLTFAGDGRLLASGGADGTVRLWETATGREVRSLRGHQSGVNAVAFSPDGQLVASASADRTVKLWAVDTGKDLRTLTGHTAQVQTVAFRGDGLVLASGDLDSRLHVWEVTSGRLLRVLTGHRHWILSVAFLPNSRTLAAGSANHSIRMWDTDSGNELGALGNSGLDALALAGGDRVLAAGSLDGRIKLWETATGRHLRDLTWHMGPCWSVALTPDGRVLASSGADGIVRLWDTESGQELRALAGHQAGIPCVAISPDGRVVASASGDSTVKLWDIASGKELRTLAGHKTSVPAVAFSADGQTLVSGSHDRTLRLWETATGAELHALEQDEEIVSVAFSPDGSVVAAGGLNGTTRLWGVTTEKELRVLKVPGERVQALDFSWDGRTLASAHSDGTVRLWDSTTGAEKKTIRLGPARGIVGSARFSTEGRYLATANGNGTVYIVRLAPFPVATVPAGQLDGQDAANLRSPGHGSAPPPPAP